MNIRKIELNDIVNVLTCNLCNIPENYHIRYWINVILTWPDLSFLAEDESGKVVGYILSSIEPDEDGDPDTPIGQVNSLSVLRPYRRLGLAQTLMNRTMEAMKREDIDIEYIQLHVRKSNKPARALYAKIGYQFHRTERKYYYDREDAYVMRFFLREQERPGSTQRRARKTWITNLWCLLLNKPHQVVEKTMSLLRRHNTHP